MSEYNYKIWYEITFSHEYWNESNPRLFNVVPTDGTNEFIKRGNLLLRQEGNKFFVLASVDWLDQNEHTKRMEFKVESLDPFLINYTQPENLSNERLTIFELAENEISTEQSTTVKSLYESLTDSSIGLLNATGTDIFQEIIYPRNHKLFRQSLDAFDEGKYTIQGQNDIIVYEKNRQKNLIAWMVIAPNNASQNQYKINLKSNEVFLKYRVTSKKHEVADLTIESIRSKEDLNPVEFIMSLENDQAIFFSRDAIKWQEKSDHSFRLMNGKKKPLIENLSTAAHKNLRFTDNHQPYLEIFIHL